MDKSTWARRSDTDSLRGRDKSDELRLVGTERHILGVGSELYGVVSSSETCIRTDEAVVASVGSSLIIEVDLTEGGVRWDLNSVGGVARSWLNEPDTIDLKGGTWI